ncbi:hypothetical protein NDU88_006594 [Pleurodeles waltl]|uniref:Uncharacterized protein n=1 Tax=Pleurodeles waltl TaxID=8319 RepID=A0AAV7NQP9_PLEWA|nr:hypothetical protein NDU88_006594 [Pleurodeles waltl]
MQTDVGLQMPEMFKQPLRTKCVTPQVPGNEAVQNTRTLTHDGNIHGSTISTAGAAHNQERTDTTSLLGDLQISESDSLQDSRPAASSQIVVGEKVDLGGAANEAGVSCLSQQDALHEVINGGRKASSVPKTDLPIISRKRDDDKLPGISGNPGVLSLGARAIRGGETGQMETSENFFSLYDQSKESDEDTSSTEIDSAESSATSIWGSSKLICKRKPKHSQLSDVCSQRGANRDRNLHNRGGAGEMQWATQQIYSNTNIADNLPISPMAGPLEHLEPPSLELIYRTMVHNHEQAQKDSRKAKTSNEQLQTLIKRVVNSCHDISVCITTMETRTDVLETEVKAAAKQSAVQESQISDIQWKLEDAENR